MIPVTNTNPLPSTTMRAQVLCDVERLELREVVRVNPGPEDVLVRVQSVGLCGTDFHIYGGHANYHTDERGMPVPLKVHPQILGHEIAGVVEETGRDVRDVRAGDRVVLDQGMNCVSRRRAEVCEYCRSGDSHQCEFYAEHGITGLPGGLAEYVTIPAVNAIKVDSDVSPAASALTEPLGCILHTMDATLRAQSRYTINDPDKDRHIRAVLICGAGPAGLLFAQHLRRVLQYDGKLIVSEPNPRRRELAESFGAETVDPSSTDLVEAVREKTGGRRVECLIEASGVGSVLKEIPGLIRKQATVVLYGHGHTGDLRVLSNVQFLEPTLIATVGASGGFDPDGRPTTYRRALHLIEEQKIEVEPFITHRYTSLEAVPAAFAGEHHSSDYVKGVVVL